jgi:hypothetical protein
MSVLITATWHNISEEGISFQFSFAYICTVLKPFKDVRTPGMAFCIPLLIIINGKTAHQSHSIHKNTLQSLEIHHRVSTTSDLITTVVQGKVFGIASNPQPAGIGLCIYTVHRFILLGTRFTFGHLLQITALWW